MSMDRVQVGSIVSRCLALTAIVLTVTGLLYAVPTIQSPAMIAVGISVLLACVIVATVLWIKADSFGRLPADMPRADDDTRQIERIVVATVALRVTSVFWIARCLVNVAQTRWMNSDFNDFAQIFLREQPAGMGIIGLGVIGVATFAAAPWIARNL